MVRLSVILLIFLSACTAIPVLSLIFSNVSPPRTTNCGLCKERNLVISTMESINSMYEGYRSFFTKYVTRTNYSPLPITYFTLCLITLVHHAVIHYHIILCIIYRPTSSSSSSSSYQFSKVGRYL